MDGTVTGEGATLGALLRSIRLERGMTQEQLGDATGLSVRSIRDLERGVSCPRVSTLRLLTQTWNLPEPQSAELHRLARSRRDRTRHRLRRGTAE
ncbi:helix-turn-helix protein [Streptomyces sp. 1114.5]|uniref:helix-turn-helix domain-containing protein n=1 Tax=unclassified Streptomyces TaxID=2593676 RepID=UPI000BD5EEF3|nr:MULTISPECIES: helix-turn-helix transcriptional regulator [unclassified Streptomyces]RKT16837.1 helix-turn-helix protein [Streptomyces sp. 1114.5]SOB83008.1 Helix-turn-helix [Streptomyces sp. 1331.2]